MPVVRLACLALSLCILSATALAFNGDRVTEGPLTLVIEKIETVTAYDTPCEVRATLSNADAAPLSVQLKLTGLVDEWRAVGPTERKVDIAPRGKATATFQIAAGKGAYSALYPVRIQAAFRHTGQAVQAQAIAVFETKFPEEPGTAVPSPVCTLPQRGAIALTTLRTQQVIWSYLKGPLVHLPIGWQGSDAESKASFSRGPVARGETRPALNMHPAYRPKAGTVMAEYRVKLPQQGPIRFAFHNAIRDSSPKEGRSDGVTFRVWIGDEKVFERHTDAKVWTPGEVNLDRFAGREVRLRLESHPGPKGNTSCDSSYWGDPILVAGAAPPALSPTDKQQLTQRTLQAARSGKTEGPNTFVFNLGADRRAALGVGPNGLADGVLAFFAAGRTVSFDGLRMSIHDQLLGTWPSGVICEESKATCEAAGRLRIEQRLRRNDQTFALATEAWSEGDGLRVKVSSPERITDLALGPADQKAPRVYYGHAYCLVEPQAFRAGGGGHNLASSHVGFDFEKGISLLTACDVPPDSLVVDPELRLYALHAHHDTQFTFVPGAKGALDCAIRYRPLYDKRPAPAVQRKAGRFVFDIWGGRYADDAAGLERLFQYGLVDSLCLMHVWQRWGYDYRLPDIFPPDPKLGSLEDLQRLGEICRKRDVPWGLHDNYIDFYPDADGYSYEHIAFNEFGQPRKAWLNQGREAQSYTWRPDRFLPFLKRNMALIQKELQPTASFVDVFTSSNGFDYYDRQGAFHSKLETSRYWGECFDEIRRTLGGNAPMSSEAGSDHLIGHLEGADCQLLHVSAEPRRFANRIVCADWACVPWFDAVNHARFILHGVGYSNRYEGGRSREAHGIESDDYLSAELLTGHALMIDLKGLGREAVRKYWLAQDVVRALAMDNVTDVQFAEGDIHHLRIDWGRGARLYFNRGATDWNVIGHTLPPYGYLASAANGSVQSSIERIGGVIAERSRAPGRFYVNGRGFDPNPRLAIEPKAQRLEYLGDRKFKLWIDWQVKRPTPKDLTLFVHFYQPQVSRLVKTGFVGVTTKPKLGTSHWQGSVVTGRDTPITIPADIKPGEYEVLVGLVDSGARRRVRLQGDEDTELRYRIGHLIVEGNKDQLTGVRLDVSRVQAAEPSRLNLEKKPVDFGLATTHGAFRCETRADRLVVTPLPDGEPFALSLAVDRLADRTVRVTEVAAVDADGRKLRNVEYRAEHGSVSFTARGDEFAYHVVWEQ